MPPVTNGKATVMAFNRPEMFSVPCTRMSAELIRVSVPLPLLSQIDELKEREIPRVINTAGNPLRWGRATYELPVRAQEYGYLLIFDGDPLPGSLPKRWKIIQQRYIGDAVVHANNAVSGNWYNTVALPYRTVQTQEDAYAVLPIRRHFLLVRPYTKKPSRGLIQQYRLPSLQPQYRMLQCWRDNDGDYLWFVQNSYK
jgi:hypothetical protein